ncbi:MAG: DNA repair protein RecO [Oscillospiraceae bacterium]|nr:DNA repair protein RecO [Oscillospiraceae bacterium]
MGTIKTKGIVIQESISSDYDKMLTMLTPGLGKINVSAKGARRPKSMLLAGSQFLCFGEYILYKGSDIYSMNSCEVIEVFYNIRVDLDKLEYASNITKIILQVTTENENTYRTLQLYLNTLHIISETNRNLSLVLSIFKLRLLKILGFCPNIQGCAICQKKEELTNFSIKNNGFECNDCSKQDKSSIKISEPTKIAIQYIMLADPKKIYSFTVSDESIKELAVVSKVYFEEKIN